MSLGLVRHFRVQQKPERTWLTGEQFNQWVREYETAPIQQPVPMSSLQKWDICLCSDQARAVHTASYFDAQKFIYTEQLREIGIAALQLGEFKLSRLRLPLSCWLLFARLSWTAGHPSQPESKAAVLQRAQMVIDSLAAEAEAAAPEGRVLIVSHGAFMKVLDRELRRRGYKAERMFFPRNGQLYLYEKN